MIVQSYTSMYEQLMSVEGVKSVEMFDYEHRGCGVYVEGGSDESIARVISFHTYMWNYDWFRGDTPVIRKPFTVWFYRDYNVFFTHKKLFGWL